MVLLSATPTLQVGSPYCSVVYLSLSLCEKRRVTSLCIVFICRRIQALIHARGFIISRLLAGWPRGWCVLYIALRQLVDAAN